MGSGSEEYEEQPIRERERHAIAITEHERRNACAPVRRGERLLLRVLRWAGAIVEGVGGVWFIRGSLELGAGWSALVGLGAYRTTTRAQDAPRSTLRA